MGRPPPKPPPRPLRVYVGVRGDDGTTSVTVDGRPLGWRPSVGRTSPAEYDWGWAGEGAPQQLALAILSDHLDDDHRARRFVPHFLSCVVRNLDGPRWELTSAQVAAAIPAGGY